MRRFSFDLDRLLELREFREREAELELARITGRCVTVDNRLREIAAEKVKVYSSRFVSGRNIYDLKSDEYYLQRMDVEKEKRLEERAKLELLRLEATARYLEASKDKKVLEKLKEKRAYEHKKLVEKEEIKTIDDIANNMRRHNASLSGEASPEGDPYTPAENVRDQ